MNETLEQRHTYKNTIYVNLLVFTHSTARQSQNRTDKEMFITKIVSEYDQEMPQSQIADNPVAPRGRAAQPSGDTRKTN